MAPNSASREFSGVTAYAAIERGLPPPPPSIAASGLDAAREQVPGGSRRYPMPIEENEA